MFVASLTQPPPPKMVNVGHTADPIVTRLVEEDKVPWYKKRNLRILYIWLFFCCMCVEATSGFDSQLINTLQFASTFQKCKAPWPTFCRSGSH